MDSRKATKSKPLSTNEVKRPLPLPPTANSRIAQKSETKDKMRIVKSAQIKNGPLRATQHTPESNFDVNTGILPTKLRTISNEPTDQRSQQQTSSQRVTGRPNGDSFSVSDLNRTSRSARSSSVSRSSPNTNKTHLISGSGAVHKVIMPDDNDDKQCANVPRDKRIASMKTSKSDDSALKLSHSSATRNSQDVVRSPNQDRQKTVPSGVGLSSTTNGRETGKIYGGGQPFTDDENDVNNSSSIPRGRHGSVKLSKDRDDLPQYQIEQKLSTFRLQNNGNNSYDSDDESSHIKRKSSAARRRSISIGYTPANNRSKLAKLGDKRGLTGLSNLGNTCFMNSILQCLSHSSLLLEYCINGEFEADINVTTSRMKGAIFRAYAALMDQMWGDNRSDVIAPTEFKNQISKFARRFIGYSEQDAHEFLVYLLEGLHEDVNRVTEKRKRFIDSSNEVERISPEKKAVFSWQQYIICDDSKIVDIFVGQLRSTLTCIKCGYESNTFDTFLELSLPIKRTVLDSEVSLIDCFEKFSQQEVLDGDDRPMCAVCRTRRKSTKRFSIQRFPRVLVIQLQRFNDGLRMRTKLNTKVSCPLDDLNLEKFSANTDSESATYSLYAVSCHSGTPLSGHYTAYAKHPFTGGWHQFNDRRVELASVTRINTSDAYLLFYQQQSTS